MPNASIKLKSGFNDKFIFCISQSFSSFIISWRHYRRKASCGAPFFCAVRGVSLVFRELFSLKDEFRPSLFPLDVYFFFADYLRSDKNTGVGFLVSLLLKGLLSFFIEERVFLVEAFQLLLAREIVTPCGL